MLTINGSRRTVCSGLSRREMLQVGGAGLFGLNMAKLMAKRQTLTGSTLRPRSDEFKALLADEIYAHAWPLFEDGTIAPVMDRTFPLEEVSTAHARMEAGEHIGKIVLKVRDES